MAMLGLWQRRWKEAEKCSLPPAFVWRRQNWLFLPLSLSKLINLVSRWLRLRKRFRSRSKASVVAKQCQPDRLSLFPAKQSFFANCDAKFCRFESFPIHWPERSKLRCSMCACRDCVPDRHVPALAEKCLSDRVCASLVSFLRERIVARTLCL